MYVAPPGYSGSVPDIHGVPTDGFFFPMNPTSIYRRQVDAYELPARRSSISAAAGDADATGDDSDGSGNERRRFLVTDTREDVVIDLVSDTGERIGTTRAKRHVMRF